MTPVTETIVIALLFCITLMLLGVAFLVYMARGGRMFTVRVTGPVGTSIVIEEPVRPHVDVRLVEPNHENDPNK